jgi:hypothetical protein
MNLKKTETVFTSTSVGTGPSSYEKNEYLCWDLALVLLKKKYLPGRGLTKVKKHCPTALMISQIVRSHVCYEQ